MSIRFNDLGRKIQNTSARSNTFKVLKTLNAPSGLRESFFRGEFSVGNIVSEGDKKFEIIDKRSNYVVLVDESGAVKRSFVDKLNQINETMEYPEGTFKGLEVKNSKIFLDIIESYEAGSFSDAYGIIKAIQTYDRDPESSINLIESFGFTIIIESTKPEQLQAVKVVADALNIHSDETDPDKLLQLVLKKSKSGKVNDIQKKILSDMLGLLKKIGLKTSLKEDCDGANDNDLETEILGYKKFKSRLNVHSGKDADGSTSVPVGNLVGNTIASHSSDTHRKQNVKKLMGD